MEICAASGNCLRHLRFAPHIKNPAGLKWRAGFLRSRSGKALLNLPLGVVLFRMKKVKKETALWASQRTVSNQLKNQTFSAKER
jgi:hypothetical protein